MLEALQMEFMQNALAAGLLASLACGVIGSLVVTNRLVFLSGGIAHAAYGGIGLAFFLGFSPALGAAGFSVGVAAIMAGVSLSAKGRVDTIIGALWAMGMAVGVILIDITPGYNVDLMSYLFGSILAVTDSDLWLMAGLDAAILVLVTYHYHHFVALSYDEEFAAVRGVPVKRLYFLLLIMTALTVVMVIRVVGLILVIALLTIPPFLVEATSRSLIRMMIFSSLLAALFCSAGLGLAYRFNLTSGAAIIAVAGVVFFAVIAARNLRRRTS